MTSQSVVLHRMTTDGRTENIAVMEVDPVSKGRVSITVARMDGTALISPGEVDCINARSWLRDAMEAIDEVGRCE